MLLDTLFTPFDWDRDFYNFRREEKDMHPYSIVSKDNKTILVHNVVGIKKEDLKVSIKTENHYQILYITGKTKDDITGQEYAINSRFTLKKSGIKEITSEVKNGLLYITIQYEEPEKTEPKVKEIEVK